MLYAELELRFELSILLCGECVLLNYGQSIASSLSLISMANLSHC